MIKNANALFSSGFSLFDKVDLNKDGIVAQEEGHANPNKAITREWILVEKKIPQGVLADGITRREFIQLSRQDGNILLIDNIWPTISRYTLNINKYDL